MVSFMFVTNFLMHMLNLSVYCHFLVKAMYEEREGDRSCISQWLLARSLEFFREGLC